ncbi:hypothetical protein F5879DRAFT_923896 [Lentinula edodes]|nr:hypothetical protein F5879DRAFT_923896 [Lentinula edodes]
MLQRKMVWATSIHSIAPFSNGSKSFVAFSNPSDGGCELLLSVQCRKTGAGVAGPSNSRGSESPSGSRTKVEVNFNPESVELDRSKPAEVVTASPWAFLPDDEKKEWSDGIKKVIARGLPRVEFELANQEIIVDSPTGFPSPERDGTIYFVIPASRTKGYIKLGNRSIPQNCIANSVDNSNQGSISEKGCFDGEIEELMTLNVVEEVDRRQAVVEVTGF